MRIKTLVTFPMSLQWRHKVGYFALIVITFAENELFPCSFQLI